MTGTRGGASAKDSAAVVGIAAGAGTRELILATAKRLFDEQGYDATSLRQIAEAVGMTKAAVYYHYPAKEHLLLELIRPMLESMSELVSQLRAQDEGADARATLAAYLDLFLDHLSVVQLLSRDPATQNHPDIGQRLRALVEAIQRQLAGADADTERIVRAACALGVVHGVGTLAPEVASASREVILASAIAALEHRASS